MAPLKDLIRGDVALARAIFGDERQRKLVARLAHEGWPLFFVAGKRAGYRSQLEAHARRVAQKGAVSRRRA
jgi:hypothetical protein